jgi:phosphoribosylamine--glycine ligase
MGKRVLVIGGGGREHALAWSLAASPRVEKVYVAPGNDGMADVAEVLAAADAAAWEAHALRLGVDLVVIGPEDPLVAGLADRLRAAGLRVFGPGAEAAQLEGDKGYAKDFLRAAGVPTARAERFEDLDTALAWLHDHPGPWVVKACGLAAGKGVLLCDDAQETARALRAMLAEGAFGPAGRSVLVEERLSGPELSVFAVLDGRRAAWFAASRDHKRLLDEDRGPNTGGMGAFTPVADAGSQLMDRVVGQILEPTLAELHRRGLDYRGLLYLGLMLTGDGPKVLEYNCRFGDPETQVVLPVFAGDLYELLAGAADGALPVRGELGHAGAAVGIVLASEGYPSDPAKGRTIEGLEDLGDEALVFHSGTRRHRGRWLTAGGRVLCAVGRGEDLATARRHAAELVSRIRFEGSHHRSDIAAKEVGA